MRSFRRPSHATIVAYLALFVALGGGALAVVRAPSRTGRISACFVARSGHIRLVNSTTRCRRGERKLTWNQRGPAGVRGPAGATGRAGSKGTSFDANATLPSKQTLTGLWAVAGGTGNNAPGVIQFSPQLPRALPDTAVHRLTAGASTNECPGPGRASPGNLCVYERAASGVTFNVITDPASGGNGANRRGAVIQYAAQAAGGYADGTWAVTAP